MALGVSLSPFPSGKTPADSASPQERSHACNWFDRGATARLLRSFFSFFENKKMSVLLPPPKRQKVYHGITEPEDPQVSEESVPNVVVQFVNDQDGSPLAPAVNLPANVTKDALESLVNKLRPHVSLFPCRPLPVFTA